MTHASMAKIPSRDHPREREHQQRVAVDRPRLPRPAPRWNGLRRRLAGAVARPVERGRARPDLQRASESADSAIRIRLGGLRATMVKMSRRLTTTCRSARPVRRVAASAQAVGGASCTAPAARPGRRRARCAGATGPRRCGTPPAAASRRACGARSRSGASACTRASAARDAREGGVDVHGRDRQHAARPQRRADGAQVGGGVGQVLDHVPEGDGVVVADGTGASSIAPCARCPRRGGARSTPPSATARRRRPRSRRASASRRKVPTWQPTSSSRPPGTWRRTTSRLSENVATRPLSSIQVAPVLDLPVRVLHPLVVRPRVHVDEAAAAAVDDAAALAELLRRRRVVPLRVDRPAERGVEAHPVVVGAAERAPHLHVAQLDATGALEARYGRHGRLGGEFGHGAGCYWSGGAPRAEASGGRNGPASGLLRHSLPTSTKPMQAKAQPISASLT